MIDLFSVILILQKVLLYYVVVTVAALRLLEKFVPCGLAASFGGKEVLSELVVTSYC